MTDTASETRDRDRRRSGSGSARSGVPAVPAYQRIAEDIRTRVRDGRLPAGTMLASRHNLAKEYGVALSTAQQAIASLIADGTLTSLDRRGTFVAHPRRTAGLEEGELVVETRASALPPTTPISPPKDSAATTLGIVSTALIDPAAAADIGSLWARQAIRALEEVSGAAGGTSLFFDRYPRERGPYAIGIDDPQAIPMAEAIQSLLDQGADALAVVALCDGRDVTDEIVAAVDVEQVPVVYLSWHEVRPPLAQVFYDGRYTGYQAAQHLLRRGYGRLICLAPFREPWLMERIEGARDAVRHANLPEDTLRVFPGDPSPERYDTHLAAGWTYQAAKAADAGWGIFSEAARDDPWGIIAPNDFTAYAALQAATEAGRTAGADYGLIGFDDDLLSCSAGLTTVRPPIEAMGQEAGRLLLQALRGETNGLQMRLRSQIIARASTTRRRRPVAAQG